MVSTLTLGFPRIGPKRELKFALESFWAGKSEEAALLASAHQARCRNWQLQRDAGIASIPSNDFSLYDHVLDTAVMVGAIPRRFGRPEGDVDLTTYFAMARGKDDAVALEMTKWFDTNYHYLVPELECDQEFRLASRKALTEFEEARALNITTRPVLLGPVSFLLLSRPVGTEFETLSLLPRLLPVYVELLRELTQAGADWVQFDEPVLVTDLPNAARSAFEQAYAQLTSAVPAARLLLATYFGGLDENLSWAGQLPVSGWHLDFVTGHDALADVLRHIPADRLVSLGVIDGRNIWRANLDEVLGRMKTALAATPRTQVAIAPSCSLLHVPHSLSAETKLDPEVRSWMAFATEKLEEVVAIARALQEGEGTVAALFAASRSACESRRQSSRVRRSEVRERIEQLTDGMLNRDSEFAVRREKQQARLSLPLLPTTTIGSFPQTQQIRAARAEFRAGKIDADQYQSFLQREINDVVVEQEALGLDVLVHGEAERNDMVEYFGEQLEGFVVTQQGWVQSYGSRCVKPPVIFGDIVRPQPMTVEWTRFAQSRTNRPMKGMLTGPVTILEWSFVRNDQPRRETCRQIALALRDEVTDLEAAGIPIIQIDEPALREGLPLRQSEWADYLDWAVSCFRLASSGVSDSTQIHTHMCYADFHDILGAVAALDADVISIETARSHMELLTAFAEFRYPNEIGPGVYDIHSPRVPNVEEMVVLLRRACGVLKPAQLWVNPDCGLKTRGWPEVSAALANMVSAARQLRAELMVT